jgi:hypothetical protein
VDFDELPVHCCKTSKSAKQSTVASLFRRDRFGMICLIADAETWLGFLAKEKNLLWALLTRKIQVRGNPKWLLAFKRCFPS